MAEDSRHDGELLALLELQRRLDAIVASQSPNHQYPVAWAVQEAYVQGLLTPFAPRATYEWTFATGPLRYRSWQGRAGGFRIHSPWCGTTPGPS